ncbi:MAG: nuclear transport factor 2 family protein [Patescibacteria group bacterium]|jgi:hypothetical protein
MTPEGLRAIAVAWLDAFNDRDIDALLKLYDENATHTSQALNVANSATQGLIQGQSQMRVWWTTAFEKHQTLRYILMHLWIDDAQSAMTIEYRRLVKGEPQAVMAEVLEVNQLGLIIRSRVYRGLQEHM